MVSMYGTLDQTSAADCIVTLRDCIADAPTAMLLDVGHVSMRPDRALEQLVSLFGEARSWPGTRIGLCAASESTAELFDAYDKDRRPDFYDDLNAGLAAAVALPVPPQETIALRADADSPAMARRFVTQTCANWGVSRLAKLASLIASELVTNAVVHARTPSVMGLQLQPTALNLSVRDSDPRPMHRPIPGATGAHNRDHGRGLLILDAMADGWGCMSTATGKVVWATIDMPPRI
jgi:Histidine kinase-like ATPase domain